MEMENLMFLYREERYFGKCLKKVRGKLNSKAKGNGLQCVYRLRQKQSLKKTKLRGGMNPSHKLSCPS